MSITVTDLLTPYEAGIVQLRDALTIVPPHLHDNVPALGEWTARQVIIHLADSEIIDAARFRQILAEKAPILVRYDQESWAIRLNYASAETDEAVTLAIALRLSTLALLKQATVTDWQRQGLHPKCGWITVADLTQLAIEHLNIHIAQLEQIAVQFGVHEKIIG